MKVRDEPVTPCTIEILPASRLERLRQERVGRRSSSGAREKGLRIRRLRHSRQDRGVNRLIASPATGRNDHVHVCQELRLALGAGAVERKPPP